METKKQFEENKKYSIPWIILILGLNYFIYSVEIFPISALNYFITFLSIIFILKIISTYWGSYDNYIEETIIKK